MALIHHFSSVNVKPATDTVPSPGYDAFARERPARWNDITKGTSTRSLCCSSCPQFSPLVGLGMINFVLMKLNYGGAHQGEKTRSNGNKGCWTEGWLQFSAPKKARVAYQQWRFIMRVRLGEVWIINFWNCTCRAQFAILVHIRFKLALNPVMRFATSGPTFPPSSIL